MRLRKDNMNKIKMIGSAVVALGLVGLYVSLYLSYKEATGTDLGACPLTEDGCTAVTKSKYSNS